MKNLFITALLVLSSCTPTTEVQKQSKVKIEDEKKKEVKNETNDTKKFQNNTGNIEPNKIEPIKSKKENDKPDIEMTEIKKQNFRDSQVQSQREEIKIVKNQVDLQKKQNNNSQNDLQKMQSTNSQDSVTNDKPNNSKENKTNTDKNESSTFAATTKLGATLAIGGTIGYLSYLGGKSIANGICNTLILKGTIGALATASAIGPILPVIVTTIGVIGGLYVGWKLVKRCFRK